jgi:polyhydroxybutyrate depolymerase
VWWMVALVGCAHDTGVCTEKQPCEVGDGSYYVLEPDKPTGEAVVFLHGYANDNVTVLKKVDEEEFLEAGIRLVMPTPNSGQWNVSGGGARDDASWIAQVADELRADGSTTVMLTGHSVGSSMAWWTACYDGEAYDAYTMTSGGFWDPMPAACGVSVKLRHVHGLADPMVPLEGRSFGGGGQSDIFDGMAIWAETNHCDPVPTARDDGAHVCSVYQDCDEPLELCLHDGGHVLRNDWEARAIAWMRSEP